MKSIVFLMLFMPSLFAASFNLNKSVQFNAGHLKHSHLYFIHNKSLQPLWLVHPIKSAGANAGWSSKIDAGRWTALSLYKTHFELTCQLLLPKGGFLKAPCDQYISVAESRSYRIPLFAKNKSFWVVENVTKKVLNDKMAARHFYLKSK